MVAYRAGRVPRYHVVSLVEMDRAMLIASPLKRLFDPSSIG